MQSRLLFAMVLVAFVVGAIPAQASPVLDPSFGTNGGWTPTRISTDPTSPTDYATSAAVDSMGRIVAVGYSQRPNTPPSNKNFAVARYNSNGTLDTTFNGTGYRSDQIDIYDCGSNAVAIDANNKIVVVGSGEFWGWGYDMAVVRYNTDGSRDNSFGSGGVFHNNPDGHVHTGDTSNSLAVTIQSDGKIVAAGAGSYYTGSGFDYQFAVARYNTNGSLDATFNGSGQEFINMSPSKPSGKNGSAAYTVKVDAQGRIVTAGYSGNASTGNYDFAIARLNASGGLDTTFNTTGKAMVDFGGDAYLYGMAIQPDGKILLVGHTFVNSKNELALARFNTDGTLDNTFGTGGLVATLVSGRQAGGKQVLLEPDGSFFVVGNESDGSLATNQMLLAHFWANGTLDNSFGTNGSALADLGGGSLGATNDGVMHGDNVVAVGSVYLGGTGAPEFIVAQFVTPEPSTFALLTAGAIGLLGYAWRRRAAKSARAQRH